MNLLHVVVPVSSNVTTGAGPRKVKPPLQLAGEKSAVAPTIRKRPFPVTARGKIGIR